MARIVARVTAAAIALAGVAVFAPASASATTDGVWIRSGSWPTNEQCQPIKDNWYLEGMTVSPSYLSPCSHDSAGYFFKMLEDF